MEIRHIKNDTYREVLRHDRKVDKPDDQPGYQRRQGDKNNKGHKVTTDSVCKLLDGGLKESKGFFSIP